MTGALIAASLLAGGLGREAQPVQWHELRRELTVVSDSFGGRLGWSVTELETGLRISHRGGERFPSASTIKTVLMGEVFRRIEAGEMKWTDQIPLPPTAQRNPSMWAAYLKEGLKVNLDGLVTLMMNFSDNTATVMLGRHLDPNRIEASLNEMGFRDTAWTSGPPPGNVRLTRLREIYANMGVTSPNEMARYLSMIHHGQLASPAASEKMIRIMSHQYWDDFIAYSAPPQVVVAAKVGALNRSRSEAGIVYGPRPFILTIYTDAQADQRWTDDNEGNEAVRRIARIVWRRMNPSHPYDPPAGAERWFPTGGGIEE
jgi:beta-lactamase class A